MGAGVVTVGRRVYAVGLYWENSPSSRVLAAAKEAAAQPGQQSDFFAVRAGQKDGRIPQFGLGQLAAGHKSGMPSFAGCLANQQPGSWIGAFRLREGTVVTIVRDDLLVPDGDQLFVDESEARERLLQEMSFGGLQRIYAPESWSIPGADNMPISLLLDEKRDVRLRPVKTPKAVIIVAGVIFAVLAIGLGIGIYLQNEAAEQAALDAERQSALARLQAQANRMVPGSEQPHYPPPVRTWEQRPPLQAVIESCRAGLVNIPAEVVGWHLQNLKCDGKTITLSWARDKGYSNPPADWVIAEGAGTATSSVALPPLSNRGHEDLANPEDITRRYLNQNWPTALAHASDDPPPPPPPGYQGTWNPPPAPWVKTSFTFSVSELPSEIPIYLHDVPGVIINLMTFVPNGRSTKGAWSIEGIIYENRV